MTIQDSEIKQLLAQAGPGQASAPTDATNPVPETPVADLNTINSAQNAAAVSLLSKPGIPATSVRPVDTNLGSFSGKFAEALKNPVNGQPLSVMAPFVFAGAKAMAPDQGNTTWDRAESNADQTEPTTAPQKPAGASAAASILGQVGAGANAPVNGGGAANAFFAGVSGNLAERQQQQKDRILMATSNAQMLHEQLAIHKLGEDAIKDSIDSGTKGMGMLLNAHIPGQLIAEGKTSDDIKRMITAKDPITGKPELDPTTQTVFLTGRQLVGKDANGIPQYRSTYSVVQPGGPVKFDETHESERKFINEQLGLKEGDQGYIQSGQQLPAVQVNHLWQQAQNAEVANSTRDAALAANDLKIQASEHSAEIKGAVAQVAKDPAVTNALANAGPAGDPHTLVKAYNNLIGTKDANGVPFLQTHPNFPEVYATWAGGGDPKNFEKMEDNFAKAQDKMQQLSNAVIGDDKFAVEHPEGAANVAKSVITASKNTVNEQQAIIGDPKSSDSEKSIAAARIAEAKKKATLAAHTLEVAQGTIASKQDNAVTEASRKAAAEAEAKKATASKDFQVDDDSLQGEDYLHALPLDAQNVIRAIGEGREQRSARQLQDKDGNASPLAKAIHRAYPNFDISKAIAYPKVREDFEKGKTGIAINSGGTALKHFSELMDLNTVASRIPYTPAYNAYMNKLNTVVGELMDFYHMPHTNESVAAMKAGMDSIGSREAAILSQAQSMGDKLGSYEQQWRNGQPNPDFTPPMPNIDPEAKAAMRKLLPKFSAEHPLISADTDADINPAKAPASAKTVDHTNEIHGGANPVTHVPASKATGYKVGDTFNTGGFTYTVTAVNPDGTIKDAH